MPSSFWAEPERYTPGMLHRRPTPRRTYLPLNWYTEQADNAYRLYRDEGDTKRAIQHRLLGATMRLQALERTPGSRIAPRLGRASQAWLASYGPDREEWSDEANANFRVLAALARRSLRGYVCLGWRSAEDEPGFTVHNLNKRVHPLTGEATFSHHPDRHGQVDTAIRLSTPRAIVRSGYTPHQVRPFGRDEHDDIVLAGTVYLRDHPALDTVPPGQLLDIDQPHTPQRILIGVAAIRGWATEAADTPGDEQRLAGEVLTALEISPRTS